MRNLKVKRQKKNKKGEGIKTEKSQITEWVELRKSDADGEKGKKKKKEKGKRRKR